MIRDARQDDAQGIRDIYNHYALNTIITFEESAVPVEAMRQGWGKVRSTNYEVRKGGGGRGKDK